MLFEQALIYCNDPDDSQRYQSCLAKLNIKCFATNNDKQLLKRLSEPFLFLMWQIDDSMPVDQALHLVAHYNHHASTMESPLIVILPASYPIELRDRFFQLGVSNIMTYPCYDSEISALASSYLTIHRKLENLLEIIFQLAQMSVRTEHELSIRKHAEDDLYFDSITDPMTGCYNRRAFEEAFNREIIRFERYDVPLTLAYFDLDHFKHINDTYGHASGDQVIIQFADILKHFCRQNDIVGRIGGEEFAILFSMSDAQQIEHRLQELCKQVEDTDCQSEHGEINYTVSIGFCQSKQGEVEQKKWMEKAADAALYKAKESGRNQVVYYHGS